jgi:hypothetical protein
MYNEYANARMRDFDRLAAGMQLSRIARQAASEAHPAGVARLEPATLAKAANTPRTENPFRTAEANRIS